MKIAELVKRTEVPKQTIHYYIRSGLLPKPRKLGSNSADYDESYVERLRLIKELQNDFFLPLPTIKQILWQHRGASKQAMLNLRREFFKPVEQYLGHGVEGDEAFLAATGLAARWLPKLKQWGMLSADGPDGVNRYSQDDIAIAKAMVGMAKTGINRRQSFQPETTLPMLASLFRDIAKTLIDDFQRATAELKPAQRQDLSARGQEIMGVLFYHLYRKFAGEYLASQRQAQSSGGHDGRDARGQDTTPTITREPEPAMTQDLYARLRKQIDQYSIGFPATESGVELEILRKLFSPDDGELFNRLSPRLESPAQIAQRLGQDEAQLAAQLAGMAERGLLFRKLTPEGPRYAAIPFIHGLFEFQVKNLDPELAGLMERYAQEANFDRAMQTSAGAFLRPIPVGRSLTVEHRVAAFEDAAHILKQAELIVLAQCVCRKQKHMVGKGCDKLSEACFMFGSMGQYYLDRGMGRRIGVEEGLEVLAKAAEAGLVTQPGTAQNPAGMCNCCGDCCGVLISLKKHPAPATMVLSNHLAKLDRDLCSGCGLCLERCQMDALSLDDQGLARLDPLRCIGCGLCVTTCPTEALTLLAKPADQRREPPKTSADQMRYMASQRGLI